jgi:NADP-dependent 3-hydroxy acid dehydrogenase YdfG
LRSRHYNIRKTVISPGAVATELTETITDYKSRSKSAAGLREGHSRRLLREGPVFAMSQPPEVDVNEILYRPTSQVF